MNINEDMIRGHDILDKSSPINELSGLLMPIQKKRPRRDVSSIGNRLKEERIRLGYSQTRLGRKIGVTKRSVMMWELNKTSPNAKYLKTAYEIGVDVGFVITGVRHV